MRKHQIMIRMIGIMLFSLMLVLFSKMEVKAWDYSGGKVQYTDIGTTEEEYPTIAIGDWEFQIKANEAVVRGYIGDNTGVVYVPDTVPYKGGEAYGVKYAAGDYPVRAIGNNAFSPSKGGEGIVAGTTYNGGNVIKVVIPATVDTIGSSAFSNNTSIKDVAFAGNSELVVIGESAFAGCTAIKNISLAKNSKLRDIGNNAFNGCIALENIELPTGLNQLGDRCFFGCEKLYNINIPSGVNAIPNYCFNNCKSLANLKLPSGLTSIGTNAFEYSGIATINFPDSITSIGNNAFYKCSSLQSVHIPKGLQTINYQTFSWCTSLKSLSIPANVTYIGTEAFSYDRAVTSITIKDGVTTIDSYAFYDIPETKSILIPYSVTNIYNKAIGYYKSEAGDRMIPGFVVKGYHDTMAKTYAKENGISFNGTNKIGLKFTYSGVNYVTTGRNTVSVAAVSNKNVNYLEIPNTVSNGAVTYKVTKIKDKAYSGCKSLVTVTIGDNVTDIGKYAFKNCVSLDTVTIGKKLTNVGDQAFYNCKNLKNTIIKSKKIKKIGTNAYKKTNKEMTVKVPKSKIKDYKKKLVKSGAAKTITVGKN